MRIQPLSDEERAIVGQYDALRAAGRNVEAFQLIRDSNAVGRAAMVEGEKLRQEMQRQPSERWGHVYLIETIDGPYRVKVGFSIDVAARLHTLQTGCPVPLKVRASWLGTMVDEHELHAQLAEHRIHGEWFDGAVVASVEAYFAQRGRA